MLQDANERMRALRRRRRARRLRPHRRGARGVRRPRSTCSSWARAATGRSSGWCSAAPPTTCERHARCSLLVLPRCAAPPTGSAGVERRARARSPRAIPRRSDAATEDARTPTGRRADPDRAGRRPRGRAQRPADAARQRERLRGGGRGQRRRQRAARYVRGHHPRRARARPEHAGRLEPRGDPADPRGVAGHADRRADDAAGAGLRAPGARRGRARLRAQGGRRRRARRSRAPRGRRARAT